MLAGCQPGSGFMVTNNEQGDIFLDVVQGSGDDRVKLQFRLDTGEALSLISSLAIAAKPNSGSPIITAGEGLQSPLSKMVKQVDHMLEERMGRPGNDGEHTCEECDPEWPCGAHECVCGEDIRCKFERTIGGTHD